jgi:hypothetical protein
VTYLRLTGDARNPFPAFAALLASRFPVGSQAALQTDNPFPIQEARPPRLGHGAERTRQPEGPPQVAETVDKPAEAQPELAVTIPTADDDGGETAPPADRTAPAYVEEDEGANAASPAEVDEENDSVPGASERTSSGFIGHKNTRIFHPVTSANLPSEENRVYFKSEDEAIASGFRRAEREGRASTES